MGAVGISVLAVLFFTVSAWGADLKLKSDRKQFTIPILGITISDDWDPMGIVVYVYMEWETRQDHHGLQVHFSDRPGRFSPYSKGSVIQAINRSSQLAGLSTEAWTVSLTFPYPNITLYGDSLSAMVGLSVVALAKGEPLLATSVLTGTITSDGYIGVVAGIPHKIQAAYIQQFQRVLIPEERDISDGDWQTPFLMQISPVRTLSQAYKGLTGYPLRS